MKNETNITKDYLSIGELSSMTGIGVHTLRMWEKRYGAPHSQRLPSGHRRYSSEEVTRLKTIASALESGYRASKVVTATIEELQELMGFKTSTEKNSIKQNKLETSKTVIESWIELIRVGKDDALLISFHDQFGRHGTLSFICDFAVPLLDKIGKGWESGEITVAQEHFASECLVSFLNEKWRQMNVRKTGPLVMITTLPREEYSLGVLMCALVTSTTNCRTIYLGVDIPLEEIIDGSKKYKPEILALSISHKLDPVTSEKMLVNLRDKIDGDISIVTGGKGSPCNIQEVSYISSFENYYEFLTQFNNF